MRKFLSLLSVVLLATALLTVRSLGQSGAVVPGDNLVVESIPTIPQALAEEVVRYTEFRGAGLAIKYQTGVLFARIVRTICSASFKGTRGSFPP